MALLLHVAIIPLGGRRLQAKVQWAKNCEAVQVHVISIKSVWPIALQFLLGVLVAFPLFMSGPQPQAEA